MSAWLKGLLGLVPLLRELLAWLREMQAERARAAAESRHATRRHRIDEAFAETLASPPAPAAPGGLPDSAPAPGGSRGAPPGSPPVPGRPGGSP